ncbi:hypothetical protein [Rhodoferax sp.]|uniref:hypothetical protein n=1 Tax=Rhodoferax sp. TaxID=50421 RepID=UPI00374D1B42
MSLFKFSTVVTAALLAWLPCIARADLQTGTNPAGTPDAPISRTARLDFIINIDKVLFLRVGNGGNFSGVASGSGPVANGAPNTLTFNSTPAIPGAGSVPVNGNSAAVAWNGTAPTFTASAAQSLPVEVRSNAGQVSLVGEATTPLSSGASVLPMSSIGITSSDPTLPAPLVPNTGPGAAVSVGLGGAGTGAAPTLLTYRSANWTFAYTPVASAAAGAYSGVITFTASAP